jgi:hypothetical protein
MAKRAPRQNLASQEYLRYVTEQGRLFVRCDKSGAPDQHGEYWKIRDDLFAVMQEDRADEIRQATGFSHSLLELCTTEGGVESSTTWHPKPG